MDVEFFPNTKQKILHFFPGNEHDPQRRWISAEINGILFCNLISQMGIH